MGIYRISYHEKNARLNLYNYGCNFKCIGCSYKLKNNEKKPKNFLKIDEIIDIIDSYKPKIVNFLGGTPCINPQLPIIVRYLKENTDIFVQIGHSNGSILPPLEIDFIRISIKAFSDFIHRDYTGVSNKNVLRNFKILYEHGVSLEASTTFIPNYIGNNEIEKIAQFISNLDENIPYRIIGYIPIPGTPWRRPTKKEMSSVVSIARKYLNNVSFSRLSAKEALNLTKTDPRYHSILIKQIL
ncbi:MAG: radical SAM protein [Promethearchaeia archaeon]